MSTVRISAIVLITAIIIAAFLLPPPQAQIGDASRILYFHVPAAQVSFVGFVVAAIFGIVYLRKRSLSADRRAAISAELGTVFGVVAMITGAIFANVTWGTYWNWDPRQTTLFIMLLVYAAYFALRQAIEIPEARARLSAVYVILAGALSPFLFFILPRMFSSLHPNEAIVSEQGEFVMSTEVRIVFFASVAGFLLLYVWLFKLADRIARIAAEEGT